MRAKVPELRIAMANDEETFKKVYKYTFRLVRPSAARSLPHEVAIAYWALLLGNRWDSHFKYWIKFITLPPPPKPEDNKKPDTKVPPAQTEKKRVGPESIAMDTWVMLYYFIGLCKTDPEFKTYNPEGT